MNYFEYNIYDIVYNDIKSGNKKIEIRLLNDKSSKIKIGDTIKFKVINNKEKYIEVIVTNLTVYNNLDEVWNNQSNILSTIKSLDEFKELIYSIYSKEKVLSSKIISISFKLKDGKYGNN